MNWLILKYISNSTLVFFFSDSLIKVWCLLNHICCTEFSHQYIIRLHFGVQLGSIFRVIVAELSKRTAIHIVPEMSEHCRWYSPNCSLLILYFRFLLFITIFCFLRVNHFVKTSKHISSCYMLECLSGLQNKAAFRNFNFHFFIISSPYI